MAVSQRVQFLNSSVEELQVLSEYLKNPKLIDDLAKEVRGLNALTADEEAKVIEGRVLIKNRADILAEIEEKNSRLSQKISDHELNLAHFESHAKSEKEAHDLKVKNLNDANVELAKKKDALTDAENHLAEAKRQLEADRKMHSDKMLADMQKINEAAEKLKIQAASQEKERQRLDDLDKAMKEKVQKIKGLVG